MTDIIDNEFEDTSGDMDRIHASGERTVRLIALRAKFKHVRFFHGERLVNIFSSTETRRSSLIVNMYLCQNRNKLDLP